jgi:hypothetical protein
MAEGLTEPQRNYRQSLARNLQKNTGRTLAQWLVLARRCPHSAPRARLRWFKETYGLKQNYAMHVLDQLRTPQEKAAQSPARVRAQLWSQPQAAQVLSALEQAVAAFPGLVSGQRKSYTAWSRTYAFAAARPVGAQVRLGLALEPGAHAKLAPARREGWSERLQSTLVLSSAAEVNRSVRALLRAAWERSGR